VPEWAEARRTRGLAWVRVEGPFWCGAGVVTAEVDVAVNVITDSVGTAGQAGERPHEQVRQVSIQTGGFAVAACVRKGSTSGGNRLHRHFGHFEANHAFASGRCRLTGA